MKDEVHSVREGSSPRTHFSPVITPRIVTVTLNGTAQMVSPDSAANNGGNKLVPAGTRYC